MAGYAAHLSLVRLVRLAVLGLALSAPGARASETWRPDTSFATGGSLTLTLGGAVATSRAAPLPDGGVVIAVSEGGAGHLVQLRADGSRDPAFGADGVAAQLAPVSEMMARAPDGRIYVGGYSGDPRVYTVRRYTPAGSPDAGFGTNGALAVTVTDDPADIALPTHVLVDAHGRILVVGVAGHRFGAVTRRVVTVARLTPQGALDPGYGTGGVAQFTQDVPGLSSGFVVGAALAPDGDLLVAAQWDNFPVSRVMRLLRLDAGGAPDVSFGGAGWVPVGASDPAGLVSFAYVGAVAVQPGGRVLVAGCCRTRVVALRPDGALDTAWGTAGSAVWDGDHEGHALLVRSDGGVVLVGAGIAGGLTTPGQLLGLTPGGAVDPAFGSGGVVVTRAVVSTSVVEPAPGRLVATGMVPTIYAAPYPLVVDGFRREAAPAPPADPTPATPAGGYEPPPGWVTPPGWYGSPYTPPRPMPRDVAGAAQAVMAANLRPATAALGRARTFARRGLRVTLSSPGPGTLRVAVLRGRKLLASGSAPAPERGPVRLVAKPRAAAKPLRRARRAVKVIVRLTWTDDAEELRPITVARAATLAR